MSLLRFSPSPPNSSSTLPRFSVLACVLALWPSSCGEPTQTSASGAGDEDAGVANGPSETSNRPEPRPERDAGGTNGPGGGAGGTQDDPSEPSAGGTTGSDPDGGGAAGLPNEPSGGSSSGGSGGVPAGGAASGGIGGLGAVECEEGASEGCGNDEGECVAGLRSCEGGRWGECLGASTGSLEQCNGLDDDCNGFTDDLEAPACALTVGVCAGARQRCDAAAGFVACSELEYGADYQLDESACDGRDNDCDGDTDEGCDCVDGTVRDCLGACAGGAQTCILGVFGECDGPVQPVDESCNEIDDDCDGEVDEDFPELGTECSVGIGACEGRAPYACNGDGSGTLCPAVALEPSDELCNGKDDDCNGETDEGLSGILTEPQVISNPLTQVTEVSFDALGEPRFCYAQNRAAVGDPEDNEFRCSTFETRTSGQNNDPRYAAQVLTDVSNLSAWSHAFTQDGQPVLCYIPYELSSDAGDLYFAEYDPVQLESTTTQLEEDGAHITACEVAVAPDGTQHIAYFPRTSSDEVVIQSRRGNLSPSEQRVGNLYGDGTALSLVVDDQDQLHLLVAISHVDSGSGARVFELWHALEGEPDPDPIASGAVSVTSSALAISSDGTVHVAFTVGGSTLEYGVRAPDGTWSLETVPITLGEEQGIGVAQLALDAEQSALIGYELSGNTRVVGLATRDDLGEWTTRTIESDARALQGALTVLPSGTVRVLFRKVNQVAEAFVCF